MTPGTFKSRVPTITPGGLMILVIVLGFSFVAMVLIPGLELSSEVVDSSVALKFVSDTERQATKVVASLDLLQDRINAHAPLEEASGDLRDAVAKLKVALPAMNRPRPANWLAYTGDTGAVAESIAGRHAEPLTKLWSQETDALHSVLAFTGNPYEGATPGGDGLNAGGTQLAEAIGTAIPITQSTFNAIDAQLNAVANDQQITNARAASQLRLVVLAGLLIAVLLVVMVTILLVARNQHDKSLREARQQTQDILRTVKDGLFLIDRNFTIGTAYSDSMESLFQRNDFAGLPFETLLKDIVSEKTLATALKFIKVLWSDRTNEKLVRSINPLGEVEMNLDVGHGRFETRYLQFEFHRVRVDRKVTHVLVSASDVSARVDLARELQASQSQAQAQVDTLLGILHIDPLQLGSFLNDSNAAMAIINGVLREPAREESAFRKKLDTLFRHAHAVKGEAAALGLSSIESRAHSFEDALKALKDKTDLSGNDFLPLVIKLDDLLTHLHSIGELVSRLSRPQPAVAEVVHTSTDVLLGAGRPAEQPDFGLSDALQRLTTRVAANNQKSAAIQCSGLETLPAEYRRVVKDIAIQAVRNSIVHGIELPSARLASAKPEQGLVRLAFESKGSAGYKLTVEDDGQGLNLERIKAVAIQKGFITPQQGDTLDARQTYSLLFKPGFSTIDQASKDAGRGMGMNVVADLVQQAGGRVGFATARGRFTRLTITLPASPAKPADTQAVA